MALRELLLNERKCGAVYGRALRFSTRRPYTLGFAVHTHTVNTEIWLEGKFCWTTHNYDAKTRAKITKKYLIFRFKTWSSWNLRLRMLKMTEKEKEKMFVTYLSRYMDLQCTGYLSNAKGWLKHRRLLPRASNGGKARHCCELRSLLTRWCARQSFEPMGDLVANFYGFLARFLKI